MRRIALNAARRIATAALALVGALSAAAAQSGDRFTVTARGLGPATDGAVLSVEAVQAAYPEFAVETEEFFAEGVRYEHIVAREGRAIVFTIEPDKGGFRDITVYSSRITDATGETIGSAYSALPIQSRRLCVLMADGSPYVACPSESDARLQYLFDSAPNLPSPEDPLRAIRVWR